MPMPERCARFAQYREKVLELFVSKGYGQVGMRELAACLGLSAGSLYHHYPSKQHLLFDLIEEFYEELLATLGRVERKGQARRKRLHDVIQRHLTLHRQMPWHFRLADREIGCLNEEQQQRISHLREKYEHELALMFGLSSRLGAGAVGILANVLNGAPGWMVQGALDEQEYGELLYHSLSGAIEHLLVS